MAQTCVTIKLTAMSDLNRNANQLMPSRLVIDALTGDVILRFLIANETEYMYFCSINDSVMLRNTLSRSLLDWQDISGLT